MKAKGKAKSLSEKEIDENVVAQANDTSAWEKPIRVHKAKAASVSLTSELAARAAFFARLHHEASVEEWLIRVIQERVELEETALAQLKRDLTVKPGA